MSALDPAGLPPRVVNDRKSPRRRTLLGGKVVYGEGKFVRDCRIRDLSETGARISLPKGEFIPERIFLLECRRPVAYEAIISWSKAPEFGLRFVNTYQLKREVPLELQYLVSLWGSLCVPLDGTPPELSYAKGQTG